MLCIDLNDPDSIVAAAQEATDVEILINNAGMLNFATNIVEANLMAG